MSTKNIYGSNLKLDIYGGSHDEKIGMTLFGIPAGERIDLVRLGELMARRAPGKNAYSTARVEADEPVFLSGFDGDVTNGDVIEAVIFNKNQRSGDYFELADTPRPSHADYAAIMKYGKGVDLRGGGHFSGRLTAPMCIAGGICIQILERRGVQIGAHIASIGDVCDASFDAVGLSVGDIEKLHSHAFPVIDVSVGDRMAETIEAARIDGDSVGGVVECGIIGLPAGLGEHMFCSVEGSISSMMFAIPAVKGIEFGLGFGSSRIRGSQNNDAFYTDGRSVYTRTNNCGGILGGMTDGMPVIFRTAFKPTPSIAREQDTVSLSKMENVKINIGGRHDPCVVPRAVPTVEAAAAIATLDLMLFDCN